MKDHRRPQQKQALQQLFQVFPPLPQYDQAPFILNGLHPTPVARPLRTTQSLWLTQWALRVSTQQVQGPSLARLRVSPLLAPAPLHQ